MATGVWTPTEAAAHIDEVWVPSVIQAQEFRLEIAPRVYREWKFAGHGDVYHIPRIANLEVATKTPGTPWQPFKYTDTEQTVLIDVYEVTGFQFEEITELLAYDNVAAEYKRKIGYALARRVDTNLAAVFQNFTTSVGALGQDLTWDDLLAAWQAIAEATEFTETTTWFMSPGMVRGLLKLDVITNQDYRRDENARAVEQATVGMILGSPVIQTNLLRSPAAGQHQGALLDRRAIALIMAQAPKAFTFFDGREIATLVGMYQVYGYARVQRYVEAPGSTTLTDNWGVLINGK